MYIYICVCVCVSLCVFVRLRVCCCVFVHACVSDLCFFQVHACSCAGALCECVYTYIPTFQAHIRTYQVHANTHFHIVPSHATLHQHKLFGLYPHIIFLFTFGQAQTEPCLMPLPPMCARTCGLQHENAPRYRPVARALARSAKTRLASTSLDSQKKGARQALLK